MKRLIFFVIVIFCFGSLDAALPPFSESKREIEAILSNSDINQYIPTGDTILQIVKTPPGYLIITNNRIVPVSIRYVARHALGPARFTVWFHKPIETGTNMPGNGESGGDHCDQNFWKNGPETPKQ